MLAVHWFFPLLPLLRVRRIMREMRIRFACPLRFLLAPFLVLIVLSPHVISCVEWAVATPSLLGAAVCHPFPLSSLVGNPAVFGAFPCFALFLD